MVRQGIKSALSALPGLISSVWSFTAALLANPVTWIVIGIIALVAALVMLWKNWDQVSAFVQNIWNGCVEKVKAGLDMIKNVFKNTGAAIKSSFSNAISSVKNVASSGMGAVKNIFSNITGAAVSTVKQKLDNMKNVYEQNGGGIRGIAAAAMEGIKGYYTAGFDFINTLTGGKLDSIKALWDGGINKIKTVVNNAVSWFKESGAKVMDTFTEGIKAAVNKPVEAVKGALAKVRELLPFSDAKEGPLSQLTLSGKRVFETINTGMEKTATLPAETARAAFQSVSDENNDASASMVSAMREGNAGRSSSYQSGQTFRNYFKSESQTSGGTIIQRLEVHVSLEKIKELPLLIKLVEEIKEKTNGNVTVTTA